MMTIDNGKNVELKSDMLTVGIVLDDTNRKREHIVETFTRKIEDWTRAAKANTACR